ncbi:MAG: hypothetical protein AAGF30_07820 [Pseudomonadota bacterium]
MRPSFSIAVLSAICASPVAAQVDPPRNPESADQAVPCDNIPYDQANCVRVLACVGEDGLWFDGEARGWESGTVFGRISNGTTCEGTWDYDGPFGAGQSRLTCSDGVEIGALYTSQDGETGTVIGSGIDTLERPITLWSGLNVLRFLTPDGRVGAQLQCGNNPIPIS